MLPFASVLNDHYFLDYFPRDVDDGAWGDRALTYFKTFHTPTKGAPGSMVTVSTPPRHKRN